MTEKSKTDNANAVMKLDLRRRFLKKYHTANTPNVFDCCQGGRVMWSQLEKEFRLKSYWGVDVKPRKGRLSLDSTLVLQQPGWKFDVVDVDTYGSPWKHYEAVLRNLQQPTTVFLTIGSGMTNFTTVGYREIQAAFGDRIRRQGADWVTPKGIAISPKFQYSILAYTTMTILLDTEPYGVRVVEAVEAERHKVATARYIGVRLERFSPCTHK